ncbi:MAG: alpha-L-arabinofuranosidase C-terminal domain-containing protein [Pirellulales bacterium]
MISTFRTISRRLSCAALAAFLVAAMAPAGGSAESNSAAQTATLRVQAGKRAAHAIPAYLTGKFAEHLGNNIYNGMNAQIVRNPTFADYPFATGEASADGVATFLVDRQEIARQLRRRAARQGWPEAELDALVESRDDGLACWWTRVGPRDQVAVSPDTGPHGGRAQRVEVRATGQGVAQWTWLPLHRTRKYEFTLVARAPEMISLTVSIQPPDAKGPCVTAKVKDVSRAWRTFSGVLELPGDLPAEAEYRVALAADSAGQFVVERLLLYPADHVGFADPDVVRLLKASRLPLLRWPGGNFVSGYHWEDGVGPVEKRPTRSNDAWGGVEPNFFGTDEFVAFCRAVGCEPMICINAGNGTPEEAARWVEYCNGPADSPQGARRAANGHPAPYGIRHWEVGNELWGRWQVHWTTASGYADRYAEFARAMRAADSTIQLYACGAPVMWGKAWNDTLIARAAPILETITDHPLVGGGVSRDCDPLDVYRDFMAVPNVLQGKWHDLAGDMARAGVRQPRVAVTELQMFARLTGSGGGARLTQQNLVSPSTQAEALYDVLIYHAAARLLPTVEMVTHSATVNHGGGLRKERERVYANPCYFAQSSFAALAGATPVAVELHAPQVAAPMVLPDLKSATKECSYGAVDALAAVGTDQSLWISLVHRGTAGPIRLEIAIEDFKAAERVELWTLSAEVPWAANSYEHPERIRPVESSASLRDAKLTVELKPYTVARVRIPRA